MENPRQSGVTLIEFMIALGLFTLIAYAVTHFFSRVSQSDAEISAKAKAQSELSSLTSLLEKDLKFREMDKLTELCTSNLCTEVSIDRLAPNGSGSFNVTYSSSCKPLPTNSIYGGLKFSQVASQCIQALQCAPGTYPSVDIVVSNAPAGVTLPPYPAITPMYGRSRTAYNLVGAAVCATKTQTKTVSAPKPGTLAQDRIILEGAFLGANNMIRIERKETVFSSNNMARIQMLPN